MRAALRSLSTGRKEQRPGLWRWAANVLARRASYPDYAAIDYDHWPWYQRFVRFWIGGALRALMKLEVEGLESLPATGAVIVAANHLNKLDKFALGILPERRFVILAAGGWRHRPRWRRVLELVVDTVFVDRGQGDQEAIAQALAVLEAGGALAIAPEGDWSHTGGLMRGRTGIARLGVMSGAPIVPAVAFGQENAGACWRRLRRVPVRVRVGAPIRLPPGESRQQLRDHTDQVMVAIARLLPERYRGVYAEPARDAELAPGVA